MRISNMRVRSLVDCGNYSFNVCHNESACFDAEFVQRSCLKDDPEEWCYPISDGLSVVAGVLCAINGVFGFAGNLLTLLAIPYATYKKK